MTLFSDGPQFDNTFQTIIEMKRKIGISSKQAGQHNMDIGIGGYRWGWNIPLL
jgi:hypothetical protein